MSDAVTQLSNIEGVVADHEDGGLTDEEAMAQIRELLGRKSAPEEITFRYLVPLEVTVNMADGEVSDVYINLDSRERVDDEPTSNGRTIADEYDDIVFTAGGIADTAEIQSYIHYD